MNNEHFFNVIFAKYFSAHNFDQKIRASSKIKRKSGVISDYRLPSPGAQGIRAFHKVNEEKILPHRRAGITDKELDG